MSICQSVRTDNQKYTHRIYTLSQFISINQSVCLSVMTDDPKYTHNIQVEYIHYFSIHIYKSICLSICQFVLPSIKHLSYVYVSFRD